MVKTETDEIKKLQQGCQVEKENLRVENATLDESTKKLREKIADGKNQTQLKNKKCGDRDARASANEEQREVYSKKNYDHNQIVKEKELLYQDKIIKTRKTIKMQTVRKDNATTLDTLKLRHQEVEN